MKAKDIGVWLHRAAALVSIAAVAACAPVEAPRLGSGPPMITHKTVGELGKAPVSTEITTFALQPLTNGPAELLFDLEDTLKQRAPTRQIKIVAADDPSADYQLKGYLSAVGDTTSTLLLYVWDITDRSGRRVHRISGQLTAGGSGTDPWAGVSGATISTTASETIDALGNWARSL